jgi:regulator of sirC expression with transglutaminase-like and TPR domain
VSQREGFVPTPFADSPEFGRLLGGDERADLTRIALEIAADAYPGLKAEPSLGTIDDLASRVRQRCPAGAGPRQVLGQINWVLFVEEGFQGNVEDYYDPRNSYLNEVLGRKTGIPLSLSVLYLALAERVGLPMAGVNLPAHFVVRAGQGGETIFVDPFHAGALLDRAGCERRVAEVSGRTTPLTEAELAPCPTGTIVARMLRNLKATYLQRQDFTAAVPVLRRLVALLGDDPLERRDLGVVCLHAGRPGEALNHLPAYLDAFPQAEDAEAVSALLRVARREVAQRN